MSIGGPSSLGTQLIQRLDTALGNTLGQTTTVTSTRADAVRQPGEADRALAARDSQGRHSRENVDRAQISNEGRQQAARFDTRQAALEALLRQATDTSSTRSAPTTLGRAARTILDLIERFPEAPPQPRSGTPLSNQQNLSQLLHSALSMMQQRGDQTATGRNPFSTLPSGTPSQATDPRASGANAARTLPSSTLANLSNVAEGRFNLPNSLSAQTLANASTQTAGHPALAPSPHASAVAAMMSRLDLSLLSQHFQQALHQIVQQSGMFYEANLARFAFGQSNLLPQLMQQPQNQPASADAAARGAAQHNTASATLRGEASTGNPNTAPTAPGTQLEPHLQSLVRQQLDVLANQQFQWRGDAWQQVPMDWVVEREQQHQGSANLKRTVATERWNSRLTLHLPQLGTVQIEVGLTGKQLSLAIHAPESANTLSAFTAQLHERLHNQGLSVNQLALHAQAAPAPQPYASDAFDHDGLY